MHCELGSIGYGSFFVGALSSGQMRFRLLVFHFQMLDFVPVFSSVALDVNAQNEVAFLLRQKRAGDDAVLASGQPNPHVAFATVLPGGGLGDGLVAAVVPPVHEEGRVQLLGRIVDVVNLEPDLRRKRRCQTLEIKLKAASSSYLVGAFGTTLGLTALHQRYDGGRPAIGVSGVRIVQADEALRVFGEVLEVSALNPASVQTFFPPTVKCYVLVNIRADVANIDRLKTD